MSMTEKEIADEIRRIIADNTGPHSDHLSDLRSDFTDLANKLDSPKVVFKVGMWVENTVIHTIGRIEAPYNDMPYAAWWVRPLESESRVVWKERKLSLLGWSPSQVVYDFIAGRLLSTEGLPELDEWEEYAITRRRGE